MNWAEGIQNAIEYIEENITEELNCEDIAARAACSAFYFQRIFGALCGMTLGEYIRCRRLSLAGCDLISSQEKVIDIAVRYGYNSPDSFTPCLYCVPRYHTVGGETEKVGTKVVFSS